MTDHERQVTAQRHGYANWTQYRDSLLRTAQQPSTLTPAEREMFWRRALAQANDPSKSDMVRAESLRIAETLAPEDAT